MSPELQQIKSIKTHLLPLSCLVVASVLNNNALLFDDKSSSTFKLVVASVTNEFSKGVTIGSPTKQCPVLNDDPAIECSLQLQVALTFDRSIKMQPIFQLIDVFVPNKNDLCSVFQMVERGHNTFIHSTSFNDSSFQLVVKSDFDMLCSEGARASPTNFNYSKISFHFCKDCRLFCEEEWEWNVKDCGKAVVKRLSAIEN